MGALGSESANLAIQEKSADMRLSFSGSGGLECKKFLERNSILEKPLVQENLLQSHKKRSENPIDSEAQNLQ